MKNIFDIDRFDEVLHTISHNKSRSLLTAFGVFWGIFMLVLLLGGGKGLQALMMSNFSNFTNNTGVIGTLTTTLPYKGYNKGRTWSMETSDVTRIRNTVAGVKDVAAANILYSKQITLGKHVFANGCIKGISPEWQNIEAPKIIYGRYINANDMQQRRKVCVIGRRLYETLFPEGGDPCGTRIQGDNVYYEIIGVDGWKNDNGIGSPPSRSLQIPVTLMNELYNYGHQVGYIAFTSHKGATVASIAYDVIACVKRNHTIASADDEAVEFFNVEVIFQMFENLFRGIDILVKMIGIGTLLCGAIGVSNIMLVAIRERTVEIGIRRAIGAKPRDILSQILSESVIITILAGLSGIVAAVAILAIAEPIIQNATQSSATFQVSFTTAIVAAAILAILGALAGIAPAMRALAIKPVDAMRDE